MPAINVFEKFGKFQEHWTPKLIAELNGQAVKLAKVSGEFVWHDHADEDELFLVFKGRLFIDLWEGETITLGEGELYVVPRGVRHRPRTEAGREAWIMLLEPLTTRHTGDVRHALTKDSCERI